MKQHIKPKMLNSLWPGLCGIISLLRKGILRGDFLANHYQVPTT